MSTLGIPPLPLRRLLEPQNLILGRPGASWDSLDDQNLILGRPGMPLGRALDVLGRPWDLLLRLWGGLGTSWDASGTALGRPGASLGRPWETLPKKYPKRAKKSSQNLISAITVFNFWGGEWFANRSAPGLGGDLPHIRGEHLRNSPLIQPRGDPGKSAKTM